MRNTIDKFATELQKTLARLPSKERYFLGITGCPAAGKSLLANSLADEINFRTGEDLAIVVPMDGFHLPNSILKARGLLKMKGAPETYDADSFVELINRLHEFPDQSVMCPAYDRKIHDPVNNAVSIQPSNQLIIVEGNYLLLNDYPWNLISTKMNEVWYIDAPLETIRKRLFYRHVNGGTSEKEAERKITSVDLSNTELIKKTLLSADKIVILDN